MKLNTFKFRIGDSVKYTKILGIKDVHDVHILGRGHHADTDEPVYCIDIDGFDTLWTLENTLTASIDIKPPYHNKTTLRDDAEAECEAVKKIVGDLLDRAKQTNQTLNEHRSILFTIQATLSSIQNYIKSTEGV